MTQTLEPRLPTDLEVGAGRMVIQFLQENKDGATASDIIKHVREDMSKDTNNLDKLVEAILENGTALGFLERKGSHYMNWMARDTCGKRRRSCSRRRRRRKIRRRNCRRRPRKC